MHFKRQYRHKMAAHQGQQADITEMVKPVIKHPLPYGKTNQNVQLELIADEEHFQQVVLDGILKARVSLDITTADLKAMFIPTSTCHQARSVINHLINLAKTGTEIRVLHAGVPTGPAIHQLRQELPPRLMIRRCPRVHTKAVIVDTTMLYLGSANLTGAGLGAKAVHRRNFELGIRTQSPHMIDQVMSYFNTIWEGLHCEGCGRRNICPVPLEEPKLLSA